MQFEEGRRDARIATCALAAAVSSLTPSPSPRRRGERAPAHLLIALARITEAQEPRVAAAIKASKGEFKQLYYGDDEGASTGPADDLARATRISEATVYDFGMAAEVGFVRIERREPLPTVLAQVFHDAAEQLALAPPGGDAG